MSDITIKRTGALFECSSLSSEDFEKFTAAYFSGDFEKALYDFLYTVHQRCRLDPEQMTDMAYLEEAGISRATVLRRCKELMRLGIAVKSEKKLAGEKPRTLYSIKATQPELTVANSEMRKIIVSEEPGHAVALFSKFDKKPLAWSGDDFIVFALAAALQSKKHSPLADKQYEVPVHIGPDRLTIRVTPAAGSKAMTIDDLRVLIVLITLLHEAVLSGKIDRNNLFTIDTNSILDLMGLNKETGHKEYIAGAIERLESTGFEIINYTKGVYEFFDGIIELKQKFRIITELRVLSLYGPGERIPQKFAMRFTEGLVERILSEGILSVHSDIFREKAPFVIRFYLWCRRMIKHNTNPIRGNMEWLHKEIEPLASKKNFNRRMRTLCEKRILEMKTHAHVMGYCFKYNQEDNTVTIWADRKDPMHAYYLHKNPGKALPAKQES